MKKIITFLFLLCICTFAKAQTFKVIQKDGTIDEFDVETVDSVVFAEKKSVDTTPHFYYGLGTTPPSTVAQIEAQDTKICSFYKAESVPSSNTSFTFNSGDAINCDGIKCIWVAVPSGWSLSSWKDNMGNEMASDFKLASNLSTEYGTKYATVGNYTVYTRRLKIDINNKYIIKVKQ